MIPLLASRQAPEAFSVIRAAKQSLIGVFADRAACTPENLTRLCSLAKALGFPQYRATIESDLHNIHTGALFLYFGFEPKNTQTPALILPSLSEIWHTPESKRALWVQLKKHKYEK